jgi:putative ABC transport system permease protein
VSSGIAPSFVWRTTWRDLAWRWRRFLIATVATALVLGLTVLLSGIIEHLDGEVRRVVRAIGDTYVVGEDVPGPFTSVSALPVGAESDLLAAGTGRADPIITVPQTITLGEPMDAYLIGARPGGLGMPEVVAGRPPGADGELVVDQSAGLTPGDVLVVSGREFRVVGTTRGLTIWGERPLLYTTLADAQRVVFGGLPVATAFLVERAPVTVPPGLQVIDAAAATADISRPLGDTVASIRLFRTLLWVVAAAIVGSILYLSALERSRDMAVFKATGAATVDLVAGLVVQALLLAGAASALAIVLAAVLAPVFPAGVSLPALLLARAPAVAVSVGVLGSLAGLRRTVATEPALAFGGPG